MDIRADDIRRSTCEQWLDVILSTPFGEELYIEEGYRIRMLEHAKKKGLLDY